MLSRPRSAVKAASILAAIVTLGSVLTACGGGSGSGGGSTTAASSAPAAPAGDARVDQVQAALDAQKSPVATVWIGLHCQSVMKSLIPTYHSLGVAVEPSSVQGAGGRACYNITWPASAHIEPTPSFTVHGPDSGLLTIGKYVVTGVAENTASGQRVWPFTFRFEPSELGRKLIALKWAKAPDTSGPGNAVITTDGGTTLVKIL
jgi:hypothetical protein